MIIELKVNGTMRSVEVSPSMRLLDMLRNVLCLTSVKEGCSEGECGACTVLLDGKAVTSCTMLALQARGKSVLTTEGLASGGLLHPIQQAFVDHDAIQCGFCTPGMILAVYALLQENPFPDRDEILRGIEGNLCRCTGYLPIIDAVQDAAERMRSHEG